jgi:hypothetical protein
VQGFCEVGYSTWALRTSRTITGNDTAIVSPATPANYALGRRNPAYQARRVTRRSREATAGYGCGRRSCWSSTGDSLTERSRASPSFADRLTGTPRYRRYVCTSSTRPSHRLRSEIANVQTNPLSGIRFIRGQRVDALGRRGTQPSLARSPAISSSSYARRVVVRTFPKEAISSRWALMASWSGASKIVTRS